MAWLNWLPYFNQICESALLESAKRGPMPPADTCPKLAWVLLTEKDSQPKSAKVCTPKNSAKSGNHIRTRPDWHSVLHCQKASQSANTQLQSATWIEFKNWVVLAVTELSGPSDSKNFLWRDFESVMLSISWPSNIVSNIALLSIFTTHI